METNRPTSRKHPPNITSGILENHWGNRVVLLGVQTSAWHWVAASDLFLSASNTACHFLFDRARTDDGWDSAYLIRTFRQWNERLAEWFEGNGIPFENINLNELVVQFRVAARRSGKGIILLYSIEKVFDYFGKEEILSFIAATMRYAWYVLISDEGFTESDIPETLDPYYVDADNPIIGPQELQIFYACTGIVLSDSIFEELNEIIGGWSFAAIALRKYMRYGTTLASTDVDIAISGWYQELDEKLFNQMELREKYTAILLCGFESFTCELATCVCPYAGAVLDSTMEKLPGIRYAKRGMEFTIHPLIRRYWLSKWNSVPKKLRDSSKTRAADYFRKQKQHESALACAIEANNYILAREILREANVHQSFNKAPVYAALLSRIDKAILHKHPMLWAYKVIVYFTANQHESGYRELTALEDRLSNTCSTSDERQAQGEILILRAFLDFGGIQAKQYLQAASEVLPHCAEIWDGSQNDFVSNSAVLAFIPNRGMTLKQASLLQHEIAVPLYSALNNWGRGFANLATAEYAFLTGNTSQMIENSNKAIAEALAYGQWDVACLANYYLLEQYLLLGQTEDILSVWRSNRAFAKHKKNAAKAIEDMADTAIYLATRQWYCLPEWVRSERAFRARNLSFRPGREYYARAVYLLAVGEYSKALRLTNEALGYIHFSYEWVLEIRLRNVKLLALCMLEETQQALNLLLENYRLAEEQGIIHHFSELRSLLLKALPFIQRLQKDVPACDFPPITWLEQLIDHTQKATENARQFEAEYYKRLPTPNNVRFTPPEYRALQLLCIGAPRESLAMEMRISRNHVKAILSRVCKKLQVTELDGAINLGRAIRMHDKDILC